VNGALLVIDSYRVRADDRSRITGDTIVAIDDIERDLAVDLVVDPDPDADPRVHTRAATVAAGAQYALVSPALDALTPAPVGRSVTRVLVATGGADAAGYGPRLAAELATALPEVRIRQVAGPWGTAATDPRVEVVHAPNGLGPELAEADLVVTAGGVTMLEACRLGRPVVTFGIVDGQERSLLGAARLGAVVATDVEHAAGAAVALANDATERSRLSDAARALIDGQGSARAAAAIAGIARQGVQAR